MYISRTEMDEVLVLIIQEALSLLDFASSIRANREKKKKTERKNEKKISSPHAGLLIMSHQ